MRISDWSSDVCSSDLSSRFPDAPPFFSRQSEIEKSARSNNVGDRREVARPAGRLRRHGKRRAGAGRHRCRTVSLRRLIELGLCYGVASGAGYLFSRLDLPRSEEHTSELQSLMRISYAVFCLEKKKYDDTT